MHVSLAEEHAPGHVDAEEQALGRAGRRHGRKLFVAHRHEDLGYRNPVDALIQNIIRHIFFRNITMSEISEYPFFHQILPKYNRQLSKKTTACQ